MKEAVPITLSARPRPGDGRRVSRAIEARRALRRPRGRVWLNGREVGGTNPRFAHLATPHD